jgi:hypothetical protein
MEQGPSYDANSFSASKESSSLLWKQKVHYCVHKALTGPYSKPDESSPQPPTLFLKVK